MQCHVRQVTDIDGDAIAEYLYDACGHVWDGTPGRYYVQQRHLRADLGRRNAPAKWRDILLGPWFTLSSREGNANSEPLRWPEWYARDNRPWDHIVSFDVDRDFAADLRRTAAEQAKAKQFPVHPQLDDPGQTTPEVRARLGMAQHESSAYVLPAAWTAKFERAAVPGAARAKVD